MGRSTRWLFVPLTITAATLGTASLASAGAATQSIDVTATATCDGEVTAEYSYELFAERSLSLGGIDFTAGATPVKRSLPDVPSELTGPRDITGTEVATGFAVGDVVVVDVRYTDSAEGAVFGVTTVQIPECPVVSDPPPETDPPVDTEVPADTEAPDTTTPSVDVTEAPVEDDSSATTVVAPTVSTLPATGEGSLPRGAVAATVVLLGVALVVLATRRRPDDQGFGTSR
jgi:hypothetical protein